jgi:hypothetical protein
MTDLTNLATVVGTDNVAPMYDPNSLWHIWNMNELYLGTAGNKKHIPKVGDEVHDIQGLSITRFVVIGINEETLIPILHQEASSTVTEALTNEDLLFGVGPGTASDTYITYIDRSVFPYRLAVDARLSIAGNKCQLCKIFLGADVSDSGVVISGIYTQSGALITENIPLELVANSVLNNYAIKTVQTCYTTFSLEDGSLVTAVFYDTAGFVISKRQMIIRNTGFIRSTDASRRYVVGVSMETPFLSTTENKTIIYPLNVALNAINLIGVVNYSDGSSARMPVDGTRFSVEGLEAYAATIIGYKTDIVLKYRLSANETAYGAYLGSEDHISEIYHIVTGNSNGSYAVKIYGYPVWIDSVNGYKIDWFLYDLDRSIHTNVTSNVLINSTITPYNPKLYGVKQTLSISLNLKEVDGTYSSFVHVQFIDIILNKPGTSRPDLDSISNWNVSAIAGQIPNYGNGVYATFFRMSSTQYKLKINANAANLAGWLAKTYNTTYPLVNGYSELTPPVPTHFTLTVGNTVVEYAITDWNGDFIYNSALVNNSTVYISFFNRTTDTDLQLSIAGMSLFQIDTNGNFI